jgi:predicted nucleic acid-binding protein
LSVYLDASVIVPIFVNGPPSAAVHAFLLGNAETILVSDFAAGEVASALSRLVRTGDLDRADAEGRLTTFDVWVEADTQTVPVEPADVRLAAALVRQIELKLRTPDALHIVTADRLGSALVTRDGRMAHASKTIGLRTIAL